MRALVFEQWQGGHYFNYLECLVPRIAQVADEVVVAITESAFHSPLFAQQLCFLTALPNVRFDLQVPLPQRASRVAYRFSLGRHLVEAIERSDPDYVFLPSGDEQTLPFPLVSKRLRTRRPIVEAVLHYKAYVSRRTLREAMTSALERVLLNAGAFSQLNFVNFLHYEEAVRRNLNLARFARAAGDPVPQPPRLDRQQARSALGLEEGGRLLGMIGALDERKAVLQTLSAFRRANLPNNDHILLAGKLDRAYAATIDHEYGDLMRAGRLVVFDRFLSELELRQCHAAIDLNCSVYVDFYGLSSLMLKSLAADVPVIANHHGWGSATVHRFMVGHTVDPHNTNAYAALLPEALDQCSSYQRTPAVKRLLNFHSIANFTDGMVERFAHQAQVGPSRKSLDWAWVMDGVRPECRALR